MLQFSIFVSKLPQIQDALVAEEPLHGDVIHKDSAELPVRNVWGSYVHVFDIHDETSTECERADSL